MNEDTMSDHAWTLERAAAYAANGLDPADARRLEDHTRDCADCAAAVADAVKFDGDMAALFATARPALGLEDRAVGKLRASRRPLVIVASFRRVAMAATVLLALGSLGAFTATMVTGGRFRLPGESAEADAARIAKEQEVQVPLSRPSTLHGLPLFDITAHDSLKKANEALTKANGERVDKNTVDFAVTSDPIGVPDAGRGDVKAVPLQTNLETSIREMDALRQRANNLESERIALVLKAETEAKARLAQNDLSTVSDKFRVTERALQSLQASSGGRGAGGVYGNATNVNGVGIGGLGGGLGGGGLGGFGGGGLGGGLGGFGGVPTPSTPPTTGYTHFKPTDYKFGFQQPPAADKPPPKADPNAGQGQAKQNPKLPAPITEDAPKVEPARRIVIRSGDMEFEVESFDAALATVTKLVLGLQGAFVGTVNSEKLPNGKVKGSVTVRTPPEHLDGLVLDLRRELGKGGELKGVRVASSDITKQYTDIESRLKAARAMEQRLLLMIKEGKGDIKQLLEAERELGVWRTKIEEHEGELRYYANLASLSTLTLTLTEKEIRTAVGVTENERVQAGVEVEDVDKAYQTLLAAVMEVKGRVTKSELKLLTAGQYNASLQFEVPPDSGGPMRDRLRMLGRVARLEIDRVQQADGGPVPKDPKVKRGDTEFRVQLYNTANVAPRETTTLQVAVPDVAVAYQAVRDAAAKVVAKVLTAQLNEQDPKNVTAQLDFEVKRTDDGTVRAALDGAGEVVSRTVGRAPEGDAVTDTKILYRATFVAAAGLRPRETTVLALDVPDVEATAAVFAAQVSEAKGRTVVSQTARDRNGKAIARLVYEVPLTAATALVERFKAAGTVRVIESARDPRAVESKYATARIDVTLGVPEPIVAPADGLWQPVRKGLSYSASVLLTSLTWVVFGLCVVLPWGLVGYGVYRAFRRKPKPTATA
jgi:hypothetical protein